MAQPETGGMRTTDGESAKLETLSDDEEITITSQDRDRKIADIRNIDICDEQSENTGYYLRSPCMGLARDRPVGSAFRQWKIQYSGMRRKSPASEWDPPFVVMTADCYGRRNIHTSERGPSGP